VCVCVCVCETGFLTISFCNKLYDNVGAQVNERTNQGVGGNALWWSEKKKTPEHKETAELLKQYGAVRLPPKPYAKKK
jgi:hypothetical protein